MAYKVSNSDFFKKLLEDGEKAKEEMALNTVESTQNLQKEFVLDRAHPLRIGAAVNSVVIDSRKVLSESGFSELALEADKIRQSADRDRFTIAVVGEFSRGKSTFINELLDSNFLPVGALPTTAVLTRIRHHSREVIIAFNEKNEKIVERELSQNSWDGLVARNLDGEEFRGTVLVGVHSKWLDNNNIEIIDTPGAGDLNDSRIKMVSDALLGCDGAIIVINATAALSMTEKMFIEERLLARKIPFMLMIVTKLDMVSVNERVSVIQYIKNKLKTWGMDIPLYIPYQVDLNDSSFDDVIGIDKIKQKIEEWITYPERVQTVERWLLEKTLDLLNHAISVLNEKRLIKEEADKDKREQLIFDKKQKLAQAQLIWGDLHLQMQKKCTDCYNLLLSKVDEYSESITEKLQYEATHADSPKRWWTEDFPYRTKIELINMAVEIENIVSKKIGEDARWYSMAIQKTFDSCIIYQKETISDKDMFGDFSIGGNLEFEDLDKQRNVALIGSAVLTISGVALISALGFMPIIATMGIGTGTTIVSEHIFKKKIEEQKDFIKKEIARCVPAFIQESLAESENRLVTVYENIIQEAEKSEKTWLKVQEEAIESINLPNEGKYVTEIADQLLKLQQQNSIIKDML